ncbi:MAG: cobyric acid synthase, partial [Verrucomicrobiota bacterium]
PQQLQGASAIVIPGSKDTISDLKWLHETGFAEQIRKADVPVLGICGGFQMLGRRLHDPTGTAGTAGTIEGLGLLPMETEFKPDKRVKQVTARFPDSSAEWRGYEIHMGRTSGETEPLLLANGRNEGARSGKIWGTYVHGFFDHPESRAAFCALAGIADFEAHPVPWTETKSRLYASMADQLETYLNLDPVFNYLEDG